MDNKIERQIQTVAFTTEENMRIRKCIFLYAFDLYLQHYFEAISRMDDVNGASQMQLAKRQARFPSLLGES